jgi:hypothetical protein
VLKFPAKGAAEYKGRRDAAAREIAFAEVTSELGRLIRR